VNDLIASNYVNHAPNAPDFGRGPEGYKRLVNLYTTAFPIFVDYRGQRLRRRQDGHLLECYGNHKGDFQGTPPTNKRISVEGITISRHANGKILESRVSWDALGMMQQLGVVPALGQAKGAGAR